jgi:hypothetical protein
MQILDELNGARLDKWLLDPLIPTLDWNSLIHLEAVGWSGPIFWANTQWARSYKLSNQYAITKDRGISIDTTSNHFPEWKQSIQAKEDRYFKVMMKDSLKHDARATWLMWLIYKCEWTSVSVISYAAVHVVTNLPFLADESINHSFSDFGFVSDETTLF